MHPSLAFGLHEFQTAPLSLRLLGPHADDVAGTTTVVHGERLRMLLLVQKLPLSLFRCMYLFVERLPLS